jgi:tetratricopeptide (TPR) repeat protein
MLRQSGITPSSSAKEINDFDVGRNRHLRDAWHALKTRKTRLEIDFLLYYPVQRQRLFDCWQTLGGTCDLKKLAIAEMEEAVGDDAPLLLTMLDRRDEALQWLLDAQRRLPSCPVTAHRLALFCHAQARRHEEAAQFVEADKMWRLAIANWTRAVLDDRCWEPWCRRREMVYKLEQSDRTWDDEKSEVRRSLLRRLPAELSQFHSRAQERGDRQRATALAELTLLCKIEAEAAQLLKEAGGLSPGGQTMTCGPLLLDRLDLHKEFGSLIRSQHDQIKEFDRIDPVEALKQEARRLRHGETTAGAVAPVVDREQALLLRCYFSELARAAVLLDLDRPDDAAAALPAAMSTPQLNPGYAALPARGGPQFRADLVQLKIRRELAVSRACITAIRPDVAGARAAWQRALTICHGPNIPPDLRKETENEISKLTLGRVSTLGEERSAAPSNAGDLLNVSIAILEAAYDVIGDRDDGNVARQLAETLLARADKKYDREDDDAVLQDLRRAHELNPHDRDTLRLYAEILAHIGDQSPDQQTAIAHLEQAVRLAEAALENGVSNEQLEQSLTWIKWTLTARRGGDGAVGGVASAWDELNRVLQKNGDSRGEAPPAENQVHTLMRSGAEKRLLPDFPGAVADFREALRCDADGSCRRWITAELTQTYRDWVSVLIVLEELDQAAAHLEAALTISPDDGRLQSLRSELQRRRAER